MKVAIYARVSTVDQNYERQLEELHRPFCIHPSFAPMTIRLSILTR